MVFGASLTGLASHPVTVVNWEALQAEGSYGSFVDQILARIRADLAGRR